MSDYEKGAVGSDEDPLEKILEEKKNEVKARRNKTKKEKKTEEEEEVIQIKEFDLNSMPPFSSKDQKNGVKIVVIGKPGCFALGTPVLYYDGSIKNVEDVKINDILMGDDNTPRIVQELYRGHEEMFEIIPKFGSSYVVNKRHDLVLINKNTSDTIEISVENYLGKDEEWKHNHLCYHSSGITCWNNDLVSISHSYTDHIPDEQKISSYVTRLDILTYLVNTYGSKDDNLIRIVHQSKTLIEDICFIARSLGFIASIDELYKDSYQITIDKGNKSSSFEIVPKGEGDYYGFRLDQNRRFLLGNFEVVKNSGKSSLIQDLVVSKAHIVACGQVFSGTEDSNHFYSEKFAPCCVFNKLDMEAIKNFVYRQKIAKRFLPNPWAIQIIDDCTDDPSMLRDPIFQAYYKNGRHWNMIHILSLQYSLDILPSIRTNIDYTFIFRESNQRNRKALWENYAGCIPNYQMFQDIMDAITEDFTALVINNRVQSNKIEDCVFWYKAKPDRIPENWKVGHPVSWEFNEARFDPAKAEFLIT